MSWEYSTKSLADDVPGYKVVRAAGEGAMGRVYVARQTALNRLVALKFLAFDPSADPAERVARFRREAAIMANLKHANVLPVFDFGEDEGRLYLVMEYVEGGDLRKRMPEGKPMPVAEAVPILVRVGEALDYLHSCAILHRDLKPENILMHGDVPKVADFGIAVERTGSGDLTKSGQGMGTLGYVAPEQQYRLAVDERADQYSLAAMAYEMLTGIRPLGLFKRPSFHAPNLPPAVDQVILKALEESPTDRHESVLAFVRALEHAFQPVPKPRNILGLGALLVVTIAAILLLGWVGQRYLRKSEPAPVATRPPVWPASESPRMDKLIRWRAHEIWQSQGSPTGEVGNAVKDLNWQKASRQVYQEVNVRADLLWKDGVTKGWIKKASDAPSVWAKAEDELFAEWKVDPAQITEKVRDDNSEEESP